MSPFPALRPLESRDVPELVQLCREHAAYERATWPERRRAPGLREWFLGSGLARCWVVEIEGVTERKLAGFATVNLELSTWNAAGYLHLDCLYLREPYRGLGLGRRLMARVAQEALDRDAVNLQWQTPEWNHSAIDFYRRLGAVAQPKQRLTLGIDGCRSLVTP